MVSPVIFSPDGAMVVAGGDDCTIAFYDTTGEVRRRITRDRREGEPIIEIRTPAGAGAAPTCHKTAAVHERGGGF